MIQEWTHGVKQKFASLDTDTDGQLVKEEVVQLLFSLGYDQQTAVDQIDDLMRKCDENGDGKITFEDFSNWIPRMHRYWVYTKYTVPAYIEKGYTWYGGKKSHPIPPKMIEHVRKTFPDK